MFADRPSHTILKADGKFEMVEDFCTHVWPGNLFIGVSMSKSQYKTSNILKMSSLTLIVCFQHTLQKQHPGG